jgi:Uri superfamily endonuclease
MSPDLLKRIEDALNIKFYDWQIKYLLKEPMVLDMRITGRTTGKTLVWVIEKLFESTEPLDLSDREKVLISSDWWCCENRIDRAMTHPYQRWYKDYVREIYTKLNNAGIQTRKVIFDVKQQEELVSEDSSDYWHAIEKPKCF